MRNNHINLFRFMSNSAYVMNGRLFLPALILCASLFPVIVLADDIFDIQMQMAKLGDPDAQFRLGEMYESGIGVNKDMREAVYWIKRAANQKHEPASFKLLYMELEKKGLNRDNRIKVEELNIKAEQGNAQAQYYLGKMYARGVGLDKNPDVAIGWLDKASQAGVLEAELELKLSEAEKQYVTQKELKFKSDPCNSKTAKYLSTCK